LHAHGRDARVRAGDRDGPGRSRDVRRGDRHARPARRAAALRGVRRPGVAPRRPRRASLPREADAQEPRRPEPQQGARSVLHRPRVARGGAAVRSRRGLPAVSEPVLSLLLVNYNTWRYCVDALRSFVRNAPTRADGTPMPWEAIVVDNRAPHADPGAEAELEALLAECGGRLIRNTSN